MHDPLVVAFEIRRPWPRRERMYDAIRPGRPDQPRWRFRLHHDCTTCTDEERARHGTNPFPWWSPRSWTPFWAVAGRGIYWPSMITVWHREPGGHDSGEVCKHYTRTRRPDDTWDSKIRHAWRWHIHHWKVQIGPLLTLRRWALTRCSWCGGRSRDGDRVNISHQWDREPGPWWRGEDGLFHKDCSSIERAHATCTCDDPQPKHGSWGKCAICGKFVVHGRTELQTVQARILAAVPAGQRDAAVYQQICDMWAAAKAEKEATDA